MSHPKAGACWLPLANAGLIPVLKVELPSNPYDAHGISVAEGGRSFAQGSAQRVDERCSSSRSACAPRQWVLLEADHHELSLEAFVGDSVQMQGGCMRARPIRASSTEHLVAAVTLAANTAPTPIE